MLSKQTKVILIQIKKESELKNEGTKIEVREANKDPMIIIDGKVSTQAMLKKLSPNGIEKIDVYKNEVAIEKYNAPNGVIVITTKKD